MDAAGAADPLRRPPVHRRYRRRLAHRVGTIRRRARSFSGRRTGHEAHAARLELRLAVHPDRRADLHRLGHLFDPMERPERGPRHRSPTSTATGTPTSRSSAEAPSSANGTSRPTRPTRASGASPTTSPSPATTTATPPPSSPSSTAARSTGSGTSRASRPYPQLWGLANDVPVPGDYDGDGDSDARRLPTAGRCTGSWSIQRPVHAADLGPVPTTSPSRATTTATADHRASPSSTRRRVRGAGRSQDQLTLQFWGLANDIPVPADYDGDGDTDIAVFHPGAVYGEWSVKGQPPFPQLWGLANDIPVPGNYDSDPASELAVFHRGPAVRGVVDPGSVAADLGRALRHPTSPPARAVRAAPDRWWVLVRVRAGARRMLKNRIRRVVPALCLVGALLAVTLAGAAPAASPPVGDWRMEEGLRHRPRRFLGVGEQRHDPGQSDVGRGTARPSTPARRDRGLRDRSRQRLPRYLRRPHVGHLGQAREDSPPRI